MNDIHKAVLREKNDFLIHEITATHILQKLLRARVIDKDQAAKVLDAHERSKNEGMGVLLQYVSRGGSKSFDNFLEVLRKENYDEVANELVKAVTRKEKLQHSKIPVTPKSNRKAMANNGNQQSGQLTYRSEEKTLAPNKSTNATKASDTRSDKTGTKEKTFIAKSEGKHNSRQPQTQATTDKPGYGSQHGVRSNINDSKSNATRQPDAAGKTKPINNGTSQSSSFSPKKTQSGNTTSSVSTKPSKNATSTTNTKTSQPSNTTSNSKAPIATSNKQANARSSHAANTQSTTSNASPSNAKPFNSNASQSKTSHSTSPSKSSHSTSPSKQSYSTSSSKQSNATRPPKQPNAARDSKPVNNKSSLMISSTKLQTKTSQTKGSEETTSTGTNNKSQGTKRDNEPRVPKDAPNTKPSLTANSKPLNSKTVGTGNAKQSKPESNKQQLQQEKAATGRTPKPAGVQPKSKPNKRFIN
ncbi:hypothetical protein LOTGIDRAFT_167117 [Lottia gigantea]|uniref:CARD domain-containing protein n=1 Tax=Lottia gigantea TaxID=225164 RepID=V3Z6Y6_LOTGI|nr:hypothetical protein LOTGIDRAFT_167117 [Lottia gigantea]ESO86593.1 hypothetical protein LOTGIDRAFT_167117 [Lottia gigantea]